MAPKKYLAFALTITTIAMACCSKSSLHVVNVVNVDQNSWGPKNPASLTLKTIPQPPIDIQIILRHSDKFLNKSIPIAVKTILPNQKYFIDTVIINLCDNNGQWIGNKRNNTRDITTKYRSNIAFPDNTQNITIELNPLNPTANIHFAGISAAKSQER